MLKLSRFGSVLIAVSLWAPSSPAKGWPVVRHFDRDRLYRVALPMGGIGTGSVSLSGRGELCDWEIMNIPRVPGKTDEIWIDMDREQTGELCRAIRSQAKCFSDIDYSTGILEGMLVGCMSQRLNRTLAWNAATKRFDDKDANALIRPFVRKGWEF